MKHNKSARFTFIDLFAGIGGFHIALEGVGGECVFAAEWDANARATYLQNNRQARKVNRYGLFAKDINDFPVEEIPDFDVLCAGFPCQPFSGAGQQKGFADKRGNLFYSILDILKKKKPKAFFLENVRNLIKHDDGKTFLTIKSLLEAEGYSFYHKVVRASDHGLPQHRPRTFMIGFRDDVESKSFKFPSKIPLAFNMSDVWRGECSREIGFTLRVGGRGSAITDRRNWDSYLVDGEVKRLSSREGVKMMGLPHGFTFPVSETQAMKQLGNSVAVPAIQASAENLINHMERLYDK